MPQHAVEDEHQHKNEDFHLKATTEELDDFLVVDLGKDQHLLPN